MATTLLGPAAPPPTDLLDPRAVRALAPAAAAGSPAALRTAAQQFEAVLLTQLLRQSGRPMLPGGLFDGPQVQARRDLFDQRFGNELAARGGVGLADALLRQIEALQPADSTRAEHDAGVLAAGQAFRMLGGMPIPLASGSKP